MNVYMCFYHYFILPVVSIYGYKLEKKRGLSLHQVAIHTFAAAELSPSAAGVKYFGYSIWHDKTNMTAI